MSAGWEDPGRGSSELAVMEKRKEEKGGGEGREKQRNSNRQREEEKGRNNAFDKLCKGSNYNRQSHNTGKVILLSITLDIYVDFLFYCRRVVQKVLGVKDLH